jgi:hypothetical protein
MPELREGTPRPDGVPLVFENSGERGGNRTFNLLIKSQLLCQLSYAPEITILAPAAARCQSISAEAKSPTPVRILYALRGDFDRHASSTHSR